MFSGTVGFVARIKGNGLSFPAFDYKPHEPGVERIQIEAQAAGGGEIRSTVHLSSVATQLEGQAIAIRVNNAALDRIAFHHLVAIEEAQITREQFDPPDPTPTQFGIAAGNASGGAFAGASGHLVLDVPADALKAELQQPSPPASTTTPSSARPGWRPARWKSSCMFTISF